MRFLQDPPRNLFFTGKGGVGKTSLACAAAVQLSDQGKRVLLVSTDPASNLDEVLGTKLANRPTSVEKVENLWGMNIDPEAAAGAYRERMVGPYRGVLPDAAVASMEEQFSGSCTLEIAAFDEFARLLGDRQATEQFDHILFDTAPTGHTLRLLTLPSAWSGYIENNTTGTSCLGPLAGLQAQQEIYRQTVASLQSHEVTRLVLVARPELSSLKEAARSSEELQALGVANQHLVVNGLFTATDTEDEFAVAMEQRCQAALASMPIAIASFPRTTIPLAGSSVLGVEALRGLGEDMAATMSEASHEQEAESGISVSSNWETVLDELARQGRGVVLTMGKGGVGKTTIASAVAVGLAERGFEVNLSTTDPAAHLAATFAAECLPGLTVGRIDPQQETADYRAEVLQTAGAQLDEQGRALLEEDLRSPCTEEIAVFRAFAKAVADGEDRFVVLDTAPTGHTILLLDSALAYHREVTRQASQMPAAVENLLPRLRDPSFTHVLVVTLPEATPVHEAARLQEDLRRAEIEPFAWVVNQSLTPLAVHDPILRQRRLNERFFIEEVESLAQRVLLTAWQKGPPMGIDSLRHLVAPDQRIDIA
ncbi:arsenical pump-driving ATPase [Bremerella cremea]|uniref:arsenite-transporting ATPase n=1 Tax=Bremerella cremea TaxID=1031537 RepID=A0A368KSF0_9BACT|nr:arsenical pump-driving ATPase [Bremerella cremea]RCS48226.1 arsenical pump-driving ATPase [Bremerella cremea]